jgi:perosamine synthetase
MAGSRFAIAVANGTMALEAALEVLDLSAGDEVITSPFTFAATVNAVLRSGARVRFADITSDYTIDAAAVRELVGERTRAIMPVHLYGLMADMDAISQLADAARLRIVEDAAQAHGARQGARRAGSTDLGCFSFYATKNITSAEGGVITTSDERLATRLRILRNQGMEEQYQYVAVGRNLRLTDLGAAVAIPQMKRLDEINAVRNRNAALLSAAIRDLAIDVRLPVVPSDRTHVWHQYTVLLPVGTDRGRVRETMRARGVGTGVYYPRLAWDYACYREHSAVTKDPTPVAEEVAARCLSLPVHQNLQEGDIDRVVDALAHALRISA